MKQGMIYCYTCQISGKSYVGQTWNFNQRYGPKGRGATSCFGNAIRKYGWDKFDCVILQKGIISQDELDDAEVFWIQCLQTISPHGYNLTEGGSGGRRAEEVKCKISTTKKGHVVSKETRKKISEANKGQIPWNKGIVCSKETRQKISEAQKGRKFSDSTRRKISEANRGRKHTTETRRKMSEAQKGRVPWNKGTKRSKETCQKISKANRGRKMKEETKRKISEAKKGRQYHCGICGEQGHTKPTCTK